MKVGATFAVLIVLVLILLSSAAITIGYFYQRPLMFFFGIVGGLIILGLKFQ